ncbi:unnamed protein product [Orchesella dallaii]|uniref:Uncharacterized protein n=1 Tax=Orchesella dallaii TaxID=48710 RepID=A0ABP1QKF0_9HEXA
MDHAKVVISVVPLQVELISLFEREILEAPMSSRTSSPAVPTKMHHCQYCSFTGSRLGMIWSHMKHCSEKKRALLRTSAAAPIKITHCHYCPFTARRRGVIMSHMKHCPLKPRGPSSDLLNSKSTTSTPQQELERYVDAHVTPEDVKVGLALNHGQEIVEPPVSSITMPVYHSMNLSSVEMDCNPTPPEHEVKLEESKQEVSPVVIDNQVVHMEPMEIEDESNETMIVLLENMSEQPNHADEHGENNLGSAVLEMSKVAIPDTNERLVFQNPLEGEADFLEKPVEDPSRHVPEFLQRPPTPDNGASAALPTVHVHHELGAQVVPEKMQASTSATVEERKVHFYVDAFTRLVYFPDWISQDVRDAIFNAEECYMD